MAARAAKSPLAVPSWFDTPLSFDGQIRRFRNEVLFSEDVRAVLDGLGRRVGNAVLEEFHARGIPVKAAKAAAPEAAGFAAGATARVDFDEVDMEMRTAYETNYQRIGDEVGHSAGTVMGLSIRRSDEGQLQVLRESGRRLGLVDLSESSKRRMFELLESRVDLGENPLVVARRVARTVPAGPWSSAAVRSRVIARTEILHAQRFSQLSSYRDMKFRHATVWDDRIGYGDEVCSALNETVVTMEEAEGLMLDEHPNGTRSFSPHMKPGEALPEPDSHASDLATLENYLETSGDASLDLRDMSAFVDRDDSLELAAFDRGDYRAINSQLENYGRLYSNTEMHEEMLKQAASREYDDGTRLFLLDRLEGTLPSPGSIGETTGWTQTAMSMAPIVRSGNAGRRARIWDLRVRGKGVPGFATRTDAAYLPPGSRIRVLKVEKFDPVAQPGRQLYKERIVAEIIPPGALDEGLDTAARAAALRKADRAMDRVVKARSRAEAADLRASAEGIDFAERRKRIRKRDAAYRDLDETRKRWRRLEDEAETFSAPDGVWSRPDLENAIADGVAGRPPRGVRPAYKPSQRIDEFHGRWRYRRLALEEVQRQLEKSGTLLSVAERRKLMDDVDALLKKVQGSYDYWTAARARSRGLDVPGIGLRRGSVRLGSDVDNFLDRMNKTDLNIGVRYPRTTGGVILDTAYASRSEARILARRMSRKLRPPNAIAEIRDFVDNPERARLINRALSSSGVDSAARRQGRAIRAAMRDMDDVPVWTEMRVSSLSHLKVGEEFGSGQIRKASLIPPAASNRAKGIVMLKGSRRGSRLRSMKPDELIVAPERMRVVGRKRVYLPDGKGGRYRATVTVVEEVDRVDPDVLKAALTDMENNMGPVLDSLEMRELADALDEGRALRVRADPIVMAMREDMDKAFAYNLCEYYDRPRSEWRQVMKEVEADTAKLFGFESVDDMNAAIRIALDPEKTDLWTAIRGNPHLKHLMATQRYRTKRQIREAIRGTDTHTRKTVEIDHLGFRKGPISDAPNYAFIAGNEMDAQYFSTHAYGDMYVKWNREIRERSTLVGGDTYLNLHLQYDPLRFPAAPMPLSDPDFRVLTEFMMKADIDGPGLKVMFKHDPEERSERVKRALRKFLNKEADYEDLQVLTGHDGMHFLEVQVHGVLNPTRDVAQVASQYKKAANKAREVLDEYGMEHLPVAAARQEPQLMKIFTERHPQHQLLRPIDINRMGRGYLEYISKWTFFEFFQRSFPDTMFKGIPKSAVRKLKKFNVADVSDAHLRKFLKNWYKYEWPNMDGTIVDRSFVRAGGTTNIFSKKDLEGPPDSVLFEIEDPPDPDAFYRGREGMRRRLHPDS